MRILIVEDNQKKLDKLKEYISKEFPDYEITDRQSYNSATKEIVLNYKNYDLMLLDMSMQTYDISEDEMGGEPEPLAGTKILSQMYLREITVKVIVVTMYENFVGTKIKQLDENLRNEYVDIYCGYVFFSHSNNEWQSNLKKIINESI